MKLAQKLAINYVRAKLNILALVSNRKAAKFAFKIFSTPARKNKKNTPAIFGKGEKLRSITRYKKEMAEYFFFNNERSWS